MQADATAHRLSGLAASMADLDGAEARLQGELQEMGDMARQAERDAAEGHYRYVGRASSPAVAHWHACGGG